MLKELNTQEEEIKGFLLHLIWLRPREVNQFWTQESKEENLKDNHMVISAIVDVAPLVVSLLVNTNKKELWDNIINYIIGNQNYLVKKSGHSISDVVRVSELPSEYRNGIREGIVIKLSDGRKVTESFKIVNKFFERREDFNDELIKNKVIS